MILMGKIKWILGNDDIIDKEIELDNECILLDIIKNLKEYFFNCF